MTAVAHEVLFIGAAEETQIRFNGAKSISNATLSTTERLTRCRQIRNSTIFAVTRLSVYHRPHRGCSVIWC